MAAVEHLGVADGTVIALEGDPDVIDSQFRLLPPSPDVLTLPALRALTVDAEDQPAGWEGEEDAKAYILMVNEAVAARHAQVAAFIAGRDAGQRRLVLTNGGSARAQVHCINQIASRLTDGDLVAAEIMYQRCTEDGVVGLKNLLPQPSESIPEHLPVVRQSEGPFDLRHGYRSVDASTQANPPRSSVSEVSAGTGLSNGSPVSPLRETRPLATRQSVVSEHDLERAASLQPRSPEGSLPHPAASTLPLSEIDGEDRQPVASIHVTRPSMIRSVSETMRSAHHLTTLSSDEAQHALLHPGGADGALFFPCPPRSPDLQSEFDFSEDEVPYEFGRAKVIQVRGRASRIPLRKTKSMDRVRSKSRVARHRVEVLQSMQAGLSPIKPRLRSKSASAAKHAGATVRAMISNTTQTDELRTRDRHAQTTLSLSTDEQFYVDKGVHVTPEGLLGPPTIQVNELLFEPVIPFQEDYIVQLFDGNEDSLLDDLLERFRRSLNAPSALTIDTIDESPRTPGLESMDAHQNYSLDRDSDDFGQPGSTDSGGSWPTMDEKQPHPTHQLSSASRLHRLHSQKGKMQKNSIGTLSLNSTPPSMVLSPLERVIEIAYSGRYKPLDIQDCFRSVLDQYAPLRTFDPVDSFFGLQSGRLWKSTLSADSSFTRAEGRLDHVVAFGVSEGVSDDLAEITHGRITQLGMKRNGLNRVITVEIR